MPTFSERMGLVEPRKALAYDEISEELRMALWNATYAAFEGISDYAASDGISMKLWVHHWHRDLDGMPHGRDAMMNRIKHIILGAKWNEVYDNIEFLLGTGVRTGDYASLLNMALSRFQAPYRVVNGTITLLDQETDVEAVEGALEDLQGLAAARGHLERSLALLSDRDNPDYANSVKESISAVESVSKSIVGKPRATLTAALDKMKSSPDITLHKALLTGWGNLYGYVSDTKGIRHGASNDDKVTQHEARYWLVTCSAFVSLLVKEAMAAGIDLTGNKEA